MVETQLCTIACAALGDVGALIFAVLAMGYAAWQRHGRTRTAKELGEQKAETALLAQERDHFRALSQRPPAPPVPVPVHVIYTAAAPSIPAPPASPSSPPPASDPDHVDPEDDPNR